MLNRKTTATISRFDLRGFSLLELILSFVLISGLLLMSFVAMRPTIEQEGPRGLVYTLAADLRAARVEAQRVGRPVAFCFASDGRTNSLSRAAHLRVGEQKGKIWRTLVYENEYEAAIFIGTWGAAVRESHELPSGWRTSTSRESALYFQPDGTVFSEDIPCLDGRYPLVVGSAMTGSFGGPDGTLSSIRHPQTVWVSKRGTVEVLEAAVPVGTLPVGGAELPPAARLEFDSESSGSPPTILAAHFLPQQVEGLQTAGIGQNFVQIHPNQKVGTQLEYGLATIEVRAEDVDGGPLRYQLRATASDGDDVGKFTVNEKLGDLSYIYDETTRRYVWKTVVSWRPPPTAPAGWTYELFMTVLDPEGNSVEVSTEAGLLPAVTSLPPARIVVCSSDSQMYLANLDGANEVLLTLNGAEHSPFFSQDGSCLFSFHNLSDSSGKELRSRPANGSTSYTRLASFTGSTSNVVYDPTYTFAALLVPAGTFNFDWGLVTQESSGGGGDSDDEEDDDDDEPSYSFSEGEEEIPVSHIYILSLMASDPPVMVSATGVGEFYWAADARHTFSYEQEVQIPKITEQGYGPFSPFPGHVKERRAKYLTGFPPVLMPFDREPISAKGRVYNPANRDWYLVVDGNRLVMGHQPSGTNYILHTASGGIEHADTGRQNPSWSADGLRVAYITSPGASSTVTSMRVLRYDSGSSFSALSSPEIEFEQVIAGASRVQLSPGGEWIYVLSNQNLLRAENHTGAELVDITAHLDKDISDYAISP